MWVPPDQRLQSLADVPKSSLSRVSFSILHFEKKAAALLCSVSLCEEVKKRGDATEICYGKVKTRKGMDPKTEKLVRRTTMVATVTAAYFLLTEDYGPNPNALDPIKRAIQSAKISVKRFFLNSEKDIQENKSNAKEKS